MVAGPTGPGRPSGQSTNRCKRVAQRLRIRSHPGRVGPTPLSVPVGALLMRKKPHVYIKATRACSTSLPQFETGAVHVRWRWPCSLNSCSLWGLNPRPMAHKTIALTTELRELCYCAYDSPGPQQASPIFSNPNDLTYRGGRSAAESTMLGSEPEQLILPNLLSNRPTSYPAVGATSVDARWASNLGRREERGGAVANPWRGSWSGVGWWGQGGNREFTRIHQTKPNHRRRSTHQTYRLAVDPKHTTEGRRLCPLYM